MKKILCFFTVIILIFSLGVCLPASAENDPVITVSQVTAVPGDTIVVSVDISNNPGIQAMTFTLSYDNSIVTYQKYEKGKLSDYTVVNHSSTGYVSFVNCENDNKKYNGTIFSVTFKVNENAAPGKYDFKIRNINPKELGDNLTGCFANKEHTTITPVIKNGHLTVGKTCGNSGHEFSEWTQTVEPTCDGKGTKMRSCKRENCGHTESAEIAAIGHDFEDKWTIDRAATETEKGSMSRHCTRCEATKDNTFFDMEISEENQFENKEETVVTPDKWEILEDIIEEEKKEEEAEKESSQKAENNIVSSADDNSDSNKTVYFIYGAALAAVIAAIAVLALILSKKGNKK